jgi:hypothetical protein
MTSTTFNLADPEVVLARRLRIADAAQRAAIRSRDMAEARALQRKSRIQTARELFDAIATLTASIDGTAQTNMARYREKLTRFACEIEDDITAFE